MNDSATVVFRLSTLMIAMFLLAGCSSNTGGDLSVENVTHVKPGMTLSEVRAIIGATGREATQADLDQVNNKKKEFGQESKLSLPPGATMHCWRQGNTWFFVNIDHESEKVTFMTRWSSS